MPVSKTTTKKAAKAVAKAAPKTAKRVTQDDIEANFERIQKTLEEFWVAHNETEKTLDELMKAQKEAHKEAEKNLEKFWETHRETEKTLDKAIKGTEKTLDRAIKETEKTLNKAIGGLSNTMGALVEHFMTAGLPKKFKQFGFAFNRITTVKWADGENNIYTEMDGLLENGEQAMVVEVKTTLRNEDVDDHLERMEKVRNYADLHGDKREFFGAIAATIVDKSSRSYALKKGFFVIEPSGEDVKITKPVSERVW
jgi:ribosome-binding ATPase YchF (GTP1/OBG family)